MGDCKEPILLWLFRVEALDVLSPARGRRVNEANIDVDLCLKL